MLNTGNYNAQNRTNTQYAFSKIFGSLTCLLYSRQLWNARVADKLQSGLVYKTNAEESDHC
jgi:hypothetical protein